MGAPFFISNIQMQTRLPALPDNKIHRAGYFIATPILGALLTIFLSGLIETMISNKSNQSLVIDWFTVIGALLFAPFLETFLCQSMPFSWALERKKSLLFTLLLMSIPFALLHAHKGTEAVVESFVGGLVLATIYIVWFQVSRAAAFSATALTHLLHNTGTLILMFNSGVKISPLVA